VLSIPIRRVKRGVSPPEPSETAKPAFFTTGSASSPERTLTAFAWTMFFEERVAGPWARNRMPWEGDGDAVSGRSGEAASQSPHGARSERSK